MFIFWSKKKFMGLVSSLRREINQRLADEKIRDIPSYEPTDIPYFVFNDIIMSKYVPVNRVMNVYDIMEMDITSAYYQSAYRLGYISREFYEKCIDLPKMDRLRLIGSLATMHETAVFVEGKEVEYDIKPYDEMHRKIWFHICKNVANCLYQFKEALDDNFLFYWVDGIYFRKKALKTARKFVQYAGIEYDFFFTEGEVERLEVTGRKFGNRLVVYKDGGSIPFDLPAKGREVNMNSIVARKFFSV